MDESPTTEDPATTDRDPRAGKREARPEKLTSLRQKLGHKAKQEPKFRFYALYDRIYRRDVLWAGWLQVRANGGSAGVDGVTIEMIEASEEGAMQLVEQLHEELRTKTSGHKRYGAQERSTWLPRKALRNAWRQAAAPGERNEIQRAYKDAGARRVYARLREGVDPFPGSSGSIPQNWRGSAASGIRSRTVSARRDGEWRSM